MQKIKTIIKDNIFEIIVIVCYAVFTLILVLNHEPWRDEAQAWTIARDLSFIDIFKQMKYEGHPALWHMLLMPFAKIGLPYITLNIISWILMVISSFLVLKKSPFTKTTKIIILLSSPFIYFYVVVSRVYTLITLLVILLAIVYPNKTKYPYRYGLLLALIANTHIVMAGFVGMAVLTFWGKELFLMIKNRKNKDLSYNKRIIIGLLIVIIGILVLYLQLSQSIADNGQVKQIEIKTAKELIESVENSILSNFVLIYRSYILKYEVLIITLIFIILMLITIRSGIAPILILIGSIGFQILLYAVLTVRYTSVTAMLLLIMILFCLWIQRKKQSKSILKDIIIESVLIIALICTIPSGLLNLKDDYKLNYSNSKDMAKYIEQNIEENAVIIGTTDFTTTSVAAYSKKYRFWSPQTEEFFTFTTWNEKRKTVVDLETFKKRVKKNLKNEESLYLLYSPNIMEDVVQEMINNKDLILLYETTQSHMVSDETYYLFKIQ